MNKIRNILLLGTLFTTSFLNAEVYTGTSVVAGFSGFGKQVRVDQYIGSTDYESIYAKVAIAQEIAELDETMASDITSLVIGIGYNLVSYKNFFIDISGEYYYQLAGGANAGEVKDQGYGPMTVLNDVDFSTPAASVGVGYSFGSWSVRADIIAMFNSPDIEFVGYTEEASPRALMGMGVTYWW